MRAVTIRANGSLGRAFQDRAAMDAFLVGDERLRALPVGFHQKLLAVTPAARSGNIRVSDGRFRIIGADDLVAFAVAVLARSGRNAGLGRLGVKAVLVGSLRLAMAIGATDLFRGCLVGEAFDILVAVDARKHAAVDGVLELGPVDEESELFAVLLFRKGRVGVAGQAIFVLELVLGVEHGAQGE